MAGAGVTMKAIWDELIANGASPIQAAGIMGNMQNESSFNPEAVGDGGNSFGLVQWNRNSYPSAHSLVTGNPLKDMQAQIKYLVQTGGLRAASGATAGQVGANFAANYERCVGCAAGGSQNMSRSSNASVIFQNAQSGKWPTSSGGSTATGSGTGTTLTGTGGSFWDFFNPFHDAQTMFNYAFGGIAGSLEAATMNILKDLWGFVVGAMELAVGGYLIFGSISLLAMILIERTFLPGLTSSMVRVVGSLIPR